jgi:uncharacterized protein (TIGR00290 family)
MNTKVLVSWSGGKDSAFALHSFLQDHPHEIVALLTTVTQGYDRISMHGVRRVLLESQAVALGYPLEEVLIPQQCSDQQYERLMRSTLAKYVSLGVTAVVFGDLFLEDVRNYREEKLRRLGMKGIFPIWGTDTHELARSFLHSGFKATVVCVDTKQLDKDFAGREYDERFLSELPANIDPCGENGEFHTFVYDGPIFSSSIRFKQGEKVLREDRFYYCDLVPLDQAAPLGANAA